MRLIVGILLIIICVFGGYVAMGGKLEVLFQPFEAVIILGAAAGAFVIANSGTVLKQTAVVFGTLFRGPRYDKAAYVELLGVQYSVFKLVQAKGVLALEQHIEDPHNSELFNRFSTFVKNHHAVEFMCDYLRLVNAFPHESDALMDDELETHRQENNARPTFLEVGAATAALPGVT